MNAHNYMKNKELQSFYNSVYEKGEKRHYTSLLLSGDKIPPAKAEVLKELSWKGKNVLDAGCGTGELAHAIAKRGAESVVGIDYSDAAIGEAKKTHVRRNLEFRCKNISDTKERFDVVVSLGTLEHLDDPFGALKQLSSLVKPKGSLIITCPNWTNVRGYILLTLKFLFDMSITKADLHYFTPVEFEAWAKKLHLKLSWRTVEQEWGHGKKMIEDLSRRLPNVFRDAGIRISQNKIKEFIHWLDEHAVRLEKNEIHAGAVALFHLKK
ncbi:MAG: class I SAM-dependent methyltransferase [Candidatus Sungbacteria bacterium]|nr:class I SAM-dependent methyltransferase [Candidatus Sungbacteria bacterium]